MSAAARGVGVYGDSDEGVMWSRAQQAQLNGLDERARFSNMLDRFEAFASVRRRTESTARAAAADTSRRLSGGPEFGDGEAEAVPRRPWSPPPQHCFLPPQADSFEAMHDSSPTGQRRRAEKSTVHGRKMSS